MKFKLPISRGKKFAKRRTQLRDQLWSDAAGVVWSRATEKGFTTIPRTLPLILRLIRHLAPKKYGNPSGVYVDLWSRVFDEGFVEIEDPEECAYASGYSGTRALRSWRDSIRALVELGFIRTKPAGNRDVAYVLLVHPHTVAQHLHKGARRRQMTDEWWNAFVGRCQAVGAVIPSADAGAAS